MQTWLKQIPKDVNFLRTPAAMNKFGNKARVRIMFLKRLVRKRPICHCSMRFMTKGSKFLISIFSEVLRRLWRSRAEI
jgi:hypothetical protein